jgi:hypothetical protein
MMQILLVGTGWLGSSEKLIVESRTRRLLRFVTGTKRIPLLETLG